MKRTVLEMMCILLIACSCTQEEFGMSGMPRGVVDRWKKRYPAGRVESLSDTAIYASALRFDEGYDWKADTLNARASLLLLRNGVPIVEIPAAQAGGGIDTHTITGGHLISWTSGGGKMAFCRDGDRLFEQEGAEIVKGVLENAGGTLWVLGQSGSKWTLRKNGAVEMEGEGTIVGDLLCDCCPPSGALYMDGSAMCFCYTSDKGGRKAWYLVQDAQTVQVSDEGIISDMKMIDGVLNVASFRESAGQSVLLRGKNLIRLPSYSGGRWKDVRILRSDAKGYLLEGNLLRQDRLSPAVYSSTGAISAYDHPGNIVFKDSRWHFIFKDGGNLVLMPYRKSAAETIEGNPYFASARCAAYFGNELYYAVSPLPGKGNPYIKKNAGDKVLELNFNGFVTGLSVCRESASVVP